MLKGAPPYRRVCEKRGGAREGSNHVKIAMSVVGIAAKRAAGDLGMGAGKMKTMMMLLLLLILMDGHGVLEPWLDSHWDAVQNHWIACMRVVSA